MAPLRRGAHQAQTAIDFLQHAGGRSVAVALPHPSGASSWIHAPGHRALLDRSLALLSEEFRRLGLAGVAATGAERVA